MKTLCNIIIVTLSALVFVSCIQDLDVKQEAGISNNEAWESSSDAEAALNGAMNLFRTAYCDDYIAWGEFRTGLWGPGFSSEAATEQIWQNDINSGNGRCSWKALYTTINQTNLILKHVPDIDFNSETAKNTVLGSALFLRAYCYYWIVRIWGDAPLCLNAFESDLQEDMFPSRAPESRLLSQIESDLMEAQRLLNGTSMAANRPNIDAVNVLMTDYYLWMYKVKDDAAALAKARTACDAVLDRKALLPNFSDVFSVENELNGEIIFAISMVKDEKEGGFASDWLVPIQYVSDKYIENPVKVGSHQQWSFMTDEYISILNEVPADTRIKATYETFHDDEKNADLRWINKYAGTWENGARSFCSDIVMYRYPDVLLFDAEICCEENDLDGALASLNQVAQRAYGEEDYYKTASKEDILDDILTERLKEFCGEGKIWWDYIRMGVVFDRVASLEGKENNKNILLWPVAQTALNLNDNLEQTEIEY